jgi:Rad3-related DNA helicase
MPVRFCIIRVFNYILIKTFSSLDSMRNIAKKKKPNLRKILCQMSRYTAKIVMLSRKKLPPETTMMKSPLMQIKQLIKVLSTPFFDGRILLTLDQTTRSTLKYILMNPNICFEEIIKQAHSVILAGGTMKPVRLDF